MSASAEINYGKTAAYGLSSPVMQAVSGVTSYSVSLTGLKPRTTYHYQVLSTDLISGATTVSGDFTFTTTR